MKKYCDSKYDVGDLIVDGDSVYRITGIYYNGVWTYKVKWQAGYPGDKRICGIPLSVEFRFKPYTSEIKYDKSKFKPFEKVLVRNFGEKWSASLFSHIGGLGFHCVSGVFLQCIPYVGNEHLLGTVDDCDEYYKSWDL